MNRRHLLKLLSLAGAGTLAVGLPRWAAAPRTAYFLITDQPVRDLARLRRLAGLDDPDAWHASATPIAPAAQDLSVLTDGALADPVRGTVPGALTALAEALRARRAPGHVLLSVEPRQRVEPNTVVFEQGGRVIDRVRLDHNYDRIDMPGVFGPTAFRLRDGLLSVVSSSCRHEHCKKMGGRSSGRIICAPNRLVATLPHRAGGLDAVTG